MFRKLVGLVVTSALATAGVVVSTTLPTAAQKVDNPGPLVFTFESGEFKLGNETASAADSDDPITATGNLAANGTLSFTALSFPPIFIENTAGVGPNPIVVHVLPQQIPAQAPGVVGFGALDPLSGIATVQFRIAVKIDGFSDDCFIGTPGNPIVLNLTTETSGSQTGVRYNTGDGLVTIVDGTFEVPGASGCEFAFISVNGTINGELGIPSPSGNNHARLTASTSPIMQAAIRPSFTATPSSGFAPLDVDFDASATYTARANRTFDWDLDNDGAFDDATGVTTSSTYPVGVHTVRLRVTDDQGDSAITTRTVTAVEPHPDLAISKTDSGSFVTGSTGTYTIGVENVGSAATSGPITVTDTLPAGVVYDSASGLDWTCGAIGQDVTCTNPGPLGVGDSADDLVITVLADGSFVGPISNTATVATFDDSDAANDSATEPGLIIQAGIDLAIVKTHDLDDGLFRGERATYILAVANDGTVEATGRVRVSDSLPPGTSFVSASGPGWVCSELTGVVSCFTDSNVPPDTSLPDINIRVEVAGDAPSVVLNIGTVTVDGDANAANDSSGDLGVVLGLGVDYDIDKAHLGTLVFGEPATYSVGVTNVGTATGGNPVTVTDVLPAGLTFSSAVGDGWTCSEATGTVECTHAGGVEPGDLMPKITLVVSVGSAALPSVTNTASVSSAGDANDANDSASDEGAVRLPQPDLEIAKSHIGNFTTASNGTYTIGVHNVAAERADGPTTVTDTLPAPLTFVSASGPGWACGAVGQTVTCTYAAVIAGGEIAPKIALVVNAPDGSEGVVTNTASVANAGDSNPANNTASDPTRIDRRPPAPTVLTAEAIVLRLDLAMVGGVLKTKIVVLKAPQATLTSNDVPVAGKVVTFRTMNGQVLCSATTNAQGIATCGPSVPILLNTILSLRYSASYDGDLDYLADSDEGAIIHINGVRLI